MTFHDLDSGPSNVPNIISDKHGDDSSDDDDIFVTKDDEEPAPPVTLCLAVVLPMKSIPGPRRTSPGA